LEELVLRGKVLDLSQRGETGAAAELLVKYGKRHSITWAMLRELIEGGTEGAFFHLLESRVLSPELENALLGLKLRADGKLDEAIARISSISSSDFSLKQFRTDALRNLYHQQSDHERIAELLVDFIRSEPKRILIKQAVAASASSEAANREDLFASAISRVFQDIDVITRSDQLFRVYWKEAVEGALSTFDIHLALKIARRAENNHLRARKVLEDTLALKEELAPIMHVVEKAHQDIRARCGEINSPPPPASVLVVFPAAALRRNKIDYPGFRADIRRCVMNIVRTLEDDGVPFSVKGRIRTHGILALDAPYFSYHTVANDRNGLHFKETDRPSLFSFDDRGYAGWSRFAQTPASDLVLESVDPQRATSFFEIDRTAIIASRLSKYNQIDTVEKLPDRFLFVALQVIGDAVQSLAYATPFAMLDEVIETARLAGLSVVVKRHPACRSPQVTHYLSEHSDELMVSVGNIHDIIPASEAVCVINSGVGAEALIYEKPVYIFGRADYMNACFVCREPGDFRKMYRPGAQRLSSGELRRFWYVYRNDYACDLRDEDHARTWIAANVRAHLKRTRSS